MGISSPRSHHTDGSIGWVGVTPLIRASDLTFWTIICAAIELIGSDIAYMVPVLFAGLQPLKRRSYRGRHCSALGSLDVARMYQKLPSNTALGHDDINEGCSGFKSCAELRVGMMQGTSTRISRA